MSIHYQYLDGYQKMRTRPLNDNDGQGRVLPSPRAMTKEEKTKKLKRLREIEQKREMERVQGRGHFGGR